MRESQRKVVCVIGTRPEAIKMAPVIQRLGREAWADLTVVATAQHRELMDQVLPLFGITPDLDLDLMRHDQSLADFSARALQAMDGVLADVAPDLLLAQGDTSTVLAGAMAAFYRRIPFAHVEAGLRSGDMDNPFPEEFNRRAASMVASIHFAPTEEARGNLLAEGIAGERIAVTGNTVIDSLLETARDDLPLPVAVPAGRRLLLVTAHRRENFAGPMAGICSAVARIVADFPDVEVIWPLHPNPNVSGLVRDALGRTPRVHLCAPLDYRAFCATLKRCTLVLTDSGGLQEEAPALAKPLLVLRDVTERPEAVAAGVARLVGAHPNRIHAEASRLLSDPAAYAAMASGVSPYGDGRAAERIVAVLRDRFAVH
ncbi:non-hydrolyzing UDP-N-acetylglucosamine 2-epimerase [Azospirillum soli]|uniref:non-hydrolyzing UDP-N-acetylglucosamine 2-epimerase n=1 Tax=Azospirillum soli TaxID=1304799 RepID=UPI0024848418|nr:UDP-N-acetylglucosamine 2-epimerase (non-hydrolyzing) [Azospirillum soli]